MASAIEDDDDNDAAGLLAPAGSGAAGAAASDPIDDPGTLAPATAGATADPIGGSGKGKSMAGTGVLPHARLSAMLGRWDAKLSATLPWDARL